MALEADDVPQVGPCVVRAVQRVVDAQDQVWGSGSAKTFELGLQVARRPESDDLQIWLRENPLLERVVP